jgi:5-methylcytosine-specific restriction enzyme A
VELQRIKELIAQDNLIKFYQCKAWRKLRQQALQRDNYECQHCKREGKVSTDELLNVHHIKEVKTHPELALDPSMNNFITLCVYHHNLIHDRLDTEKKKEDKFFIPERW